MRKKKSKNRKNNKCDKNKVKIILILLIGIILLIITLLFLCNVCKDDSIDGNIVNETSNTSSIVEKEEKAIVTFMDSDGSVISQKEVYIKQVINKPKSPKKDGYDFVEWQLNGVKYDFTKEVTSDITLEAKWSKIKNKYTVYFNSNGGTSVEKQIITDGNKAYKPKNPKKTGYDFVEWQLDGNKYDFTNAVKKSITLKAKWSKIKNKYTVTFDSDGGSAFSKQIVEEDSFASKPINPEKEGYKFVEWQLSGIKYDFSQKVKKNITLKAKWNKKNKYTVTFKSEGEATLSEQIVEEGDKVTKPADPLRDGYKFVEWQLNGAKYDFTKEVITNITLVAKWSKQYSTGESVEISGEGFNVIRDNGDSVTLLAKYNVSSSLKQSKSIIGVALCSEKGWGQSGVNIDLNLYSGTGISRVKGYESYLKTLTLDDSLTATLLTRDDLIELGCSSSTCINKKNASWIIRQQPFWLRTTSHLSKWSFYYVNDRGNIAGNYDVAQYGIRPVITISKSSL